MKEYTVIFSSLVSAILAVAGYELVLRSDETRIAEELAVVRVTVSENKRTIERMRTIVDEWDDLKISLIREGLDINILEKFIDNYTSEYLESNIEKFRGPPGKQGAAGQDASQFIVYPSDSMKLRRLDIDAESLIRGSNNTFLVPQSESLDNCKIDDSRYKREYPDFDRNAEIKDICAANVVIAHIQDEAIFEIGDLEVSVLYGGGGNIEDIEIGANYTGYQHTARFQFKGDLPSEDAVVLATPGDTIYIRDPNNRAVGLKFVNVERKENGLFFNIHPEKVILE